MFQCPVAALIPAENIKLSNLYIDAKHIVSLLTLICFMLIQLNLLQHDPGKINTVAVMINIAAMCL